VVLDGDDRLLEVRRDLREVDVDVSIALVVEDVDEAALCVVDAGIDLRLHVADGRRVRKLALVGVVAREDRADSPGADRGEDGDRDEHDAEHAPALAWGAQMPVGTGPTAAQFRSSGGFGGADSRVVRAGRASRRRRAVRQGRPAAPGFGGLVEAHEGTVKCIGEMVS
jgi:hypothetical protein